MTRSTSELHVKIPVTCAEPGRADLRPAASARLLFSRDRGRPTGSKQRSAACNGAETLRPHRGREGAAAAELSAADGFALGPPTRQLISELAKRVRSLDGDQDRHGGVRDTGREGDVQATAESEEVTIEVLQQDQAKPLVSARRTLREFMEGFHNSEMAFTFGPVSAPKTMHLIFSADWTPAEQASTEVAAAAETHRPWFMRASYYYETTKSVYDYTTSFRVVKPFARLGEATVNSVLATVSGKTLYDVDQSLVVPVLDAMDNKVDATISVAFTKLYEGQQMAVRTKDKAVRAVSNVAHKTGSTVVGAANYTTHKVTAATGAVYGTVTGVADYAGSQVKHASSSTYGAQATNKLNMCSTWTRTSEHDAGSPDFEGSTDCECLDREGTEREIDRGLDSDRQGPTFYETGST
ncbi:hypothetical protein ON010_g12683 [Phytophthora cinnamomi]|nr:hypothetical protein ON010_g12683 [Phytophthora cinnamomi]